MAKRFTDSDKWSDPWFCSISISHKMFWVYLLDNCDNAGLWKVNWPLVKFHLGQHRFDPEVFNKRIVPVKEDLWFLPKFIEFQYGELSTECNPHKPVIKILEKYGLNGDDFKGISTLPSTLKAQDQDKDKDNTTTHLNKETKIRFLEFVYLTQGQFDQLAQKLGRTVLDEYVARLNNYVGSKGVKYKSHYHTILNWANKDGKTIIAKKDPDPNCEICNGLGYLVAQFDGKKNPCRCVK